MNTRPWLMRMLLVGALVPTACSNVEAGSSSTAASSGAHAAPPADAGQNVTPELPSVATCGSVALGRSYVGILGDNREDDRLDQAVGVERDMPVINTRWYQFEVEERLYSVFQSYPHGSLFTPEGVVGTFNGVRPERTFARVMQGPLTAVKLFEISFKICLLEIEDRRSYSLWDDDMYQDPPTPQNARPFCEELLLGMYQRPPVTEELDECVAYATVDVATEPEPVRQWAHVCGLVGSMTASWTR